MSGFKYNPPSYLFDKIVRDTETLRSISNHTPVTDDGCTFTGFQSPDAQAADYRGELLIRLYRQHNKPNVPRSFWNDDYRETIEAIESEMQIKPNREGK